MSVQFPVQKPRYGAPCNGCGLCCADQLCITGQQVFAPQVKGPCPAMTSTDGGTWGCGLVLHPASFMPARVRSQGQLAVQKAAAIMLGVGLGCDAAEAGEVTDPAFRAVLHRWLNANERRVRRAAAVLGLSRHLGDKKP